MFWVLLINFQCAKVKKGNNLDFKMKNALIFEYLISRF